MSEEEEWYTYGGPEPGMDTDIMEAFGVDIGSNQGRAPALEDDSPRDVKKQDASRLLSNSKPRTRFGTLQEIWTLNEMQRVSEIDGDIEVMVNMLGGDGGAYHKKRLGAVNRIVAELYSPPRVTAAAKFLPDLGLIPGFAMDLTNGWDFNDAGMRAKAWETVRRQTCLCGRQPDVWAMERLAVHKRSQV